MSIRLSARLQAVAMAVPEGARVIDVGTDHARIPVWLAQTGRAGHVWASDIRPGPLKSAAALVARTGAAGVELRQADGLSGFGPADGDTVILAGMGGETMVSILAAAPWTKKSAFLILEPQSKQALLRRWLIGNGYMITKESLVADGGRIYPILLAKGGVSPSYTPAELYTGLFAQISGDRLFGAYLDGLMKRAAAAAPYDQTAAALLAEYKTMKRRLANGCCGGNSGVSGGESAGGAQAGF